MLQLPDPMNGIRFDAAEVVFGVLPFSQLSPSLDASTLATSLRHAGVRAKVLYFNRTFAGQISGKFYDQAAAQVALNSLLGDWVFSEAAFGAIDDRAYLKSLVARGYIESALVPFALHSKRAASRFIENCANLPDWRDVKILCLVETSAKRDAVSGQLMASLSLASRLKQLHPSISVVVSGHSTEGEMGSALKSLPFLDYVCTYSDHSDLLSVVASILEYGRERGSIAQSRNIFVKTQSNATLNSPIPDFDDYFELKGDGLPGCFESIPIEASKGCWWAERNHCSFCALPGEMVRFRSKEPDAFINEFCVQMERYSPKKIEFNDLIINQKYLEKVFPNIAELNHGASLFIETKAHLKGEHLETLARAGVTSLQAGIETLSATSLRRMTKGVSVERNIAFLRDCTKYGIHCYWNYLHSFPGESPGDIEEAIPHIRAEQDGQPPSTIQPVRVERFSPYFSNLAAYNLVDVCPDRSYYHVYGSSGIDLSQLAFYHEHREINVDTEGRIRAVTRLRGALEEWRLRFGRSPGSLTALA